MVVGRSDFALRAATDALPMRDAFAVLFFGSVGMLLDPALPLRSPGLVAASLAVVMIGTPVVTCTVVLLLGRPVRSAVGLDLADGRRAATGRYHDRWFGPLLLGSRGYGAGPAPRPDGRPASRL